MKFLDCILVFYFLLLRPNFLLSVGDLFYWSPLNLFCRPIGRNAVPPVRIGIFFDEGRVFFSGFLFRHIDPFKVVGYSLFPELWNIGSPFSFVLCCFRDKSSTLFLQSACLFFFSKLHNFFVFLLLPNLVSCGDIHPIWVSRGVVLFLDALLFRLNYFGRLSFHNSWLAQSLNSLLWVRFLQLFVLWLIWEFVFLCGILAVGQSLQGRGQIAGNLVWFFEDTRFEGAFERIFHVL